MKLQTIILMLLLSLFSVLSIAGVVERNVRRDAVYTNPGYRGNTNVDINSSTQVDVNGNTRSTDRNVQYDNSDD